MTFEEVLVQILSFCGQNGWQITVIAILGIICLGLLKHFNVFKKVDKAQRKPLYLLISVGFSVLGTAIYLAIINQFDFNYLVGVSTIMYGLNQAMYSIYENTKLRDLLSKLFMFMNEQTKK